MKTVVIYHRADFDGIFCREIARKFFGNNSLGRDVAEYIGWDYGDPVPDLGAFDRCVNVVMLDISIDELMTHPNLTWIDHHKSAIEKYSGPITGYRIDGVAACRLAWQWFFPTDPEALPVKQDYINRQVHEPEAVRLAGEYDIWDKRDPDAELFQHGLRSQELTDHIWSGLLDLSIEETLMVQHSRLMCSHLLEAGQRIQYVKTRENESIIKAFGFTFEWEGLKFLACNAARFNSHLFTAGLTPEHDGCFGFNWSGKDWRVSLYGVPGKDIDLSRIAVKYGGGGHRGACGFRTDKLPFLA